MKQKKRPLKVEERVNREVKDEGTSMVLEAYDLNIHHKGLMVGQISNIYADRYCYTDLETDAWQLVLPSRRPNHGVKLVFHHDVLDGRNKKLVESDTSLIDMFATHTMTKLIEVHVQVVEEENSHLHEPSGGVVLNEKPHDDLSEPGVVKSIPSASARPVDQKSDEKDPGVNHKVDSDEVENGHKGVDSENESDSEASTDHEDDSSSYMSDSGSEDCEWTSDSGEDTVGKRLTRGTLPYLNGQGKVVLEKGMVFHNNLHFRDVLRDFAVENGFTLSRRKNKKTRMRYLCSVEDCPWRIYASVLQDGRTIRIKSYTDEHTCQIRPQNKEATSIWIARALAEEFVRNPRLSLKLMKSKLKEMYGLENESRAELYRARTLAIEELESRKKECIETIPSYTKYMDASSQMGDDEPAPLTVLESMKSRTVQCKVCGELGHNKRSCKEARRKRTRRRRFKKQAAAHGGTPDGDMELKKVNQVKVIAPGQPEDDSASGLKRKDTPGVSQSPCSESLALSPQQPLSARARAILRKTEVTGYKSSFEFTIRAETSQSLEANNTPNLEGTRQHPIEILDDSSEIVAMKRKTKGCKRKTRSTNHLSSAATQDPYEEDLNEELVPGDAEKVRFL